MVTTVKPKARATPAKPMPGSGTAAASTALPQPPRTSQKVPTNSAVRRCIRDIGTSPLIIGRRPRDRSEEHTSELQSLMRISYAVFCLKTKTTHHHPTVCEKTRHHDIHT